MCEIVECTFEKPIYERADQGLTIGLYRTTDKSIVITGSMLPVAKKIKFNMKGEWVNHPKYGRQFKVTEGYEMQKPSSKDSIIEYLSSGFIKGIGEKTAKKIVDKFGTDTIAIMDTDIERLLEVKGITTKKIERIKASYEETFAGRDTVLLLGKHGISPKLAIKVYQKYKDKALVTIEKKPFLLCCIPGITFPVADSIHSNNDESYELNFERFISCANFVLNENENNGLKLVIGDRASGSISMSVDDFGKAMLKLLHRNVLNGKTVLDYTIRMIQEGKIKCVSGDGRQYVYKLGLYRIEKATAEAIARLSGKSNIGVNLDALIYRAENEINIKLSQEQKRSDS